MITRYTFTLKRGNRPKSFIVDPSVNGEIRANFDWSKK